MATMISQIHALSHTLDAPMVSALSLDELEPSGHQQVQPLSLSPVAAGFPSPADDFIETHLNVHQYVVQHPAATFFVRVSGDSMTGAGLYPGDILVVDRSLKAQHNDVIVAALNGEFTVKRLGRRGNRVALIPDNPNHRPVVCAAHDELIVWGVVTHSIHHVD